VTAHEDADEAARGPKDLSKMRAEQVTRAMVAAGIPADRIETKWVGASKPLVQTDDPEPLNRVVEIDMRY
jgi:outer membrane protein OmpA-like peptidoglycan-associated protein